ncbi:unnamed protein product [Boreogadus saida]
MVDGPVTEAAFVPKAPPLRSQNLPNRVCSLNLEAVSPLHGHPLCDAVPEHTQTTARAHNIERAGDGAKRLKPPIKNAFSVFDTLESRSRETPGRKWQTSL